MLISCLQRLYIIKFTSINRLFSKKHKQTKKNYVLTIEEKANLESTRYLGALDMLSMPPATTTSLAPNWIDCAASIVAARKKTENGLSKYLGY